MSWNYVHIVCVKLIIFILILKKTVIINEAHNRQEKADELAEIMNEGISPYAWYYYDTAGKGYVVYLDNI